MTKDTGLTHTRMRELVARLLYSNFVRRKIESTSRPTLDSVKVKKKGSN